jgi:hypothetical protein
MELGSKEWFLPISRMGGNQWRVKGEANLEEGTTDETRIWTGRNSDRYLKDGVGRSGCAA